MRIVLTQEQREALFVVRFSDGEHGVAVWVHNNFPEIRDRLYWIENGVIYVLDDEERQKAIKTWAESTEQAIEALRSFKARLRAWELRQPHEIDKNEFMAALKELSEAGLESWADECPVSGGLDVLAEAVTGEEV